MEYQKIRDQLILMNSEEPITPSNFLGAAIFDGITAHSKALAEITGEDDTLLFLTDY